MLGQALRWLAIALRSVPVLVQAPVFVRVAGFIGAGSLGPWLALQMRLCRRDKTCSILAAPLLPVALAEAFDCAAQRSMPR